MRLGVLALCLCACASATRALMAWWRGVPRGEPFSRRIERELPLLLFDGGAITAVFVEHCESRLEWPLVFWLKDTLPLSILDGPLASIEVVLQDSRLEGPLLCRLRYVALLSRQLLMISPSLWRLAAVAFNVADRDGELSKMCFPITDFCAVFGGVGVTDPPWPWLKRDEWFVLAVVAGIDCVERGSELLQYTGDRRRMGEQSLEEIRNVDSLDMWRRWRRGNVEERWLSSEPS